MKKILLLIIIISLISCQDEQENESVQPRRFQKIKIINPSKLTYLLGELPNFDDLKVVEVFTDGYEKENTTYTVHWDGDIFKSGVSTVIITARNQTATFDIFTENKLVDTGLPVVYVDTEDGQPINSKDTYVNSKITITNNDRVIHTNSMRIRGRGNATWTYPKKPYRFKLDNKANLLDMGVHNNWTLLANYCDKTLMRTSIAFKLSELLNFPWTPKSRFVEFVLNGEYMGNYNLVETIQQGENRINIPDNGFIIERDGYYLSEPVWFITKSGHGFSFKNPDTDDLTEEQFKYISNHMNEFETVLYSELFKDPVNGYAKYINIESFVRWFLFQQIIANLDTNPYIIKEDMTTNSKLSMGPVWDFEWSLGIGWYDGSRPRPPDYWVCYWEWYFHRLLQDDVFVIKLQQMWKTYYSSVTHIILQYINDVQNEIMRSQEINFKRWDIMNDKVSVGGIPMGSFEKEVKCDSQFFINHMNWLQNVISNL